MSSLVSEREKTKGVLATKLKEIASNTNSNKSSDDVITEAAGAIIDSMFDWLVAAEINTNVTLTKAGNQAGPVTGSGKGKGRIS